MKKVNALENYYCGLYSYHIFYNSFNIDYFTIMTASVKHARKELRTWLKSNGFELAKIEKL